MKITDNELLNAIWNRQVSQLPTRVIHRFIGGGIAVCENDADWCMYSSYISRTSRHLLTKKIGSQQLLKRLRDLSGKDLIKLDTNAFWIKNQNAFNAFAFARRWWLERGVPTGCEPYIMPSGRESSRAKTIIMDNWEDVSEELKCELLNRFTYVAEGETRR